MFQRRIKIHEQKEEQFREVINSEAFVILSPIAELQPGEVDPVSKDPRIGNCLVCVIRLHNKKFIKIMNARRTQC